MIIPFVTSKIRRITFLGLILWAWSSFAPSQTALAQQVIPPQAQLRLIEDYYRQDDSFRAESEILSFLYFHPDHPRRGEAELVRAKLYYREERYQESSLMLFSLLDRHPEGAGREEANRLLTFSLVREGRLEQAGERMKDEKPGLDELGKPPPEAVEPNSAVSWSTWLPGSGFFLLGEPGKAAAALSLNLFFITATIVAINEELTGAALVFLLTEIALYRGGREAVRDAAQAKISRLKKEQADQWVKNRGEDNLMKVGFSLGF